jgi:hypothetical protein
VYGHREMSAKSRYLVTCVTYETDPVVKRVKHQPNKNSLFLAKPPRSLDSYRPVSPKHDNNEHELVVHIGTWRRFLNINTHLCPAWRRRRRRRNKSSSSLFVFNDTIEGPRAPAVKPGRVTQA